MDKKKALRGNFVAFRKDAASHADEKTLEALWKNINKVPEFSSSQKILMYAAKGSEAPTSGIILSLLKKKKQVALPISHEADKSISLSYISSLDDIAPGAFGVPEPKAEKAMPCAPEEIEVVVVPGISFDLHGHRLGHGLGYYDRFLPRLSCKKIGLAFDVQIIDELPREAHDHPLDYIVSEQRVIRIK